MKSEKFKDLFNFAAKSKLSAGEGLDDGNFPFYTSSFVLKKRINDAQYFDESIIFGTGGSASIHFSNEPFSTSTDCFVVFSKKEDVNTKFIYYYLYGNIHLLEKGFKGAGLKHISKKYIENLNIPIFPLDIQNKIVSVLDKASNLRKKRQETIKYLNDFLESIFLELFGLANPDFNNWEEIEISSLAKPEKRSMRTGPFGSSLKHEEFEEEGDVAVLGIDNAVNNVFKWGKKRYISWEKYQKFKQYTIYSRDVIITIMGTIGRSAVIPDDFPTTINTKHLAAITVDETKCNPYYLSYSIHSSPFVKFQLKSKRRGAIMDGLNLGIIKEIRLKAAPITLQNDFEKIYLKNKKIIDKLEKNKLEIDILFNSIIQKAFNGQLNFNIDFELDSLIKEIDLNKKQNDLSKIIGDISYLQRLIDKLNAQEFKEKDLYDRAKHVVFQMMLDKEKSLIVQQYNEVKQNIELALK